MPKQPRVSPEVALETAIAALQALSNLTVILVQAASAAGVSPSILRKALDQLDEANQAMIQQPESAALLGGNLATARELLPNDS